jgi:hypothetical protein
VNPADVSLLTVAIRRGPAADADVDADADADADAPAAPAG